MLAVEPAALATPTRASPGFIDTRATRHPPLAAPLHARHACITHAYALGEAGLHMEEESGRTVLLLEVAVEVEAHLASADAGS